MSDDESNCGNCRFWLARPTKEVPDMGQCRKYQPEIVSGLAFEGTDADTSEVVLHASQFPRTLVNEWCGEFRHKNRSV